MPVDKKTAAVMYEALQAAYPDAACALHSGSTMELLVATILSAQCTDERVNLVTKSLFKKYRTVRDFARAEIADFEREIRSTGFFRNKARNIIRAAQIIEERFNGRVPDTMEALVSLPGVARKTANIILFNAYGKNEGVAVDTHVQRLSQRIGLSAQRAPEKIEKDLQALFARQQWGQLSHLLITHGRRICRARKPDCPSCGLRQWCVYYREAAALPRARQPEA
ncbi:MAG: endonuclease III [Candidatus Omnitrophica bacterium]|nr:endonuclease III [Candidatus Omnitrophota bacterium]